MKKLNKDIGNYCENLALEYLIKTNYKILDNNFKNLLGEIDIICTIDNLLIIVEVKGRYDYTYGLPREAISYSKQKNIIKVATAYISYRRLFNLNVRFDVIEIYLNKKNSLIKINHIKDAFRL